MVLDVLPGAPIFAPESWQSGRLRQSCPNGSIGKTVDCYMFGGSNYMYFFTYVLQSASYKRRYYGSCKNLQIRLKRHNQSVQQRRIGLTQLFIPNN